jgi:hypothetical protein
VPSPEGLHVLSSGFSRAALAKFFSVFLSVP